MNIVGEGFNKKIVEQIKQRQKTYGSINRDNEQLSYLNNKLTNDSILDQQNTRKGENSSYSANLIYTEPLGKKSLLEFKRYIAESLNANILNATALR